MGSYGFWTDGSQIWVDRLHPQNRRAANLKFVDPAEGMELSCLVSMAFISSKKISYIF